MAAVIRKGDKFRLVKGEGMAGQKHVCTGTAKERVHGHEGITLIKFTAADYHGKACKYAVPADWCVYEPPNGPARKKRYDPQANSRRCYEVAIAAIRAKKEAE